MKIGKYQVTLARPVKPDTSGNEQGGAGTAAQGYFNGEEYLGRVRNPSIYQIMEMIDNDGTAQALYNVITFPVKATKWHLEPDPDDVLITTDANGAETETHPQADFVESCLRNPQHKGGMSTPFSLVLSEILLGVAQGHRFFEIVYKLDDQGRVVFQKVVGREDKEYTIKTDDTGGFAGVEQKVKKDGKTQTVRIELPYCFLYTYRKEREKLKGLSAFRPGWYHYDKKHRLYYLQNQQAQVQAINYKLLESPENAKKEDRDENLAAVDKMAVRPSIALPFGWKLNVVTPGRGMDLAPAIDHQDVQMARAVLAQGMLLGNQTASTGGSYALSESHMDLFMLGERALMGEVAEHITAFLISKLHEYNFAKPLYSEFKFEDLSDPVMALLQAAVTSMLTKGSLPQWITDGIADKVGEQLEIEKPDDATLEAQKAADEKAAAEAQAVIDQKAADAAAADTTATQSRKKKASRLSKSEWWRELTAAEAKVQFSNIQKKADDAEAAMLDGMKPVYDKIAADATKRLRPLLEADGAKALDGFELKFGDEFRKVIADHMLDAYSVAKTAVADEIKKKSPANKQTTKDLIKQHTQAVVDKQYGDLLFNLKTIVTTAIRKNLLDKTELSVSSVLLDIAGMFDDFWIGKEPPTVSSIITNAINTARDDVFQQYSNDIYAYQYSAILDDKVCPICEDLDQSVVGETDYMATKWIPPIHFNCRCIWVAIMNDETDKPSIEGLPDAPGGATEPTLAQGPRDGLYLTQEARWQSTRT